MNRRPPSPLPPTNSSSFMNRRPPPPLPPTNSSSFMNRRPPPPPLPSSLHDEDKKLKNLIINNLKPYSELKSYYALDKYIYRSANANNFSGNFIDIEPHRKYDEYEPKWFSANKNDASEYCELYNDEENITCEKNQYKIVDNKNIMFLNLNDKQKEKRLNNELIESINNKILSKPEYLYTVDPQLFRSAYQNGRFSTYQMDRIFTIELFKIVEELNIERELNCIFMGYYHNDTYKIDPTKMKEYRLPDIIPAEYTIRMKYINEEFMSHEGVVFTQTISKNNTKNNEYGIGGKNKKQNRKNHHS